MNKLFVRQQVCLRTSCLCINKFVCSLTQLLHHRSCYITKTEKPYCHQAINQNSSKHRNVWFKLYRTSTRHVRVQRKLIFILSTVLGNWFFWDKLRQQVVFSSTSCLFTDPTATWSILLHDLGRRLVWLYVFREALSSQVSCKISSYMNNLNWLQEKSSYELQIRNYCSKSRFHLLVHSQS